MNIDWFAMIASFLGILSVSILATASSGNLRKSLAHIPVKKICWATLIAVGAYWYITVPYISSHSYSPDKTEYARPDTDSEQAKRIADHQIHIDQLRRDVAETRVELKSLQQHYRNVVQIGWFALLYLGLYIILGRKDSPNGKFDLDSYKQ